MKTDKAKEKRKRRKTKCDKPVWVVIFSKKTSPKVFLIYILCLRITAHIELQTFTGNSIFNTCHKFVNFSGAKHINRIQQHIQNRIWRAFKNILSPYSFNTHIVLIRIGFSSTERKNWLISWFSWLRRRHRDGVVRNVTGSNPGDTIYQYRLSRTLSICSLVLYTVLVLRTRPLVHGSRKINRRYSFIK